jgi:hypothetical protein
MAEAVAKEARAVGVAQAWVDQQQEISNAEVAR